MALVKLPPLPEGISPFYLIINSLQTECATGKVDYIDYLLITSDNQISYSSNFFYITGKCFYIKKGEIQWKEIKENYYYNKGISIKVSYFNISKVLYSNYDVLNQGSSKSVIIPKSTKATDIKVSCGEFIEMTKGMIWNIGQAVTLEPSNTFQACNFKSSNPDVCKVTEDGTIIAVGDGECVITITSKL
ncbi:hypothetical protein ACOT7R_16670 [Clostridium perfringens]|uniref:hypothetical protein n=1 Tax=Clostridium perfringens TaxID=1502 RepID=UPI002900241F|nr:hypothetical protein [Clostridium perfringens]MDU3019940.1 hypothetical protein [Clostridium perfringens]